MNCKIRTLVKAEVKVEFVLTGILKRFELNRIIIDIKSLMSV